MAYVPSIEDGLKHIVGRETPESLEAAVLGFHTLLKKDQEKIFGPLGRLRSFYQSKSLIAWYRDHNLYQCKEFAFLVSMVRRMEHRYRPSAQTYGVASDLLYPLLSDNEEIIHWHSQFMLPLLITLKNESTRCLDLAKHEYHGMQARQALQEEWDLLIRRCEERLRTAPKKDKLHLIDYEFYLGLAEGNITAMEEALNKLLSPKVARHRNKEMQWGLEERLLSSWGFIYAKMAWRKGYKLEVDNPWIPQEWLPIKPLESYPLPHDFLESLDIFEQFTDNEKSWCSRASLFSPRPPSEAMFKFPEAMELIGKYCKR